MIREYAIVPELFDLSHPERPEAKFVLMELLRDLEQLGLLRVDSKDKWRSQVEMIINDTSTDFWNKQVVKRLFSPTSKNFIPGPDNSFLPETPDTSEWEAFFRASHKTRSIERVISTSTAETEPPHISLSELQDDNWWLERPSPTWEIHQSERDYWRIIQPLLQNTRYLTFIDPYFSPEEHYYSGIGKLLADIGKAKASTRIFFHTQEQEQNDSNRFFNLAAWSECFREGIDVVIWQHNDLGNYANERFLLTESKSFTFTHAFATNGKSATVSVVDQRRRQRIDSYFAKNRSSKTRLLQLRGRKPVKESRFQNSNDPFHQ